MKKKLQKLWLMCLCLGYLLGIHDGRLALWRGDDPEPVHIFYVRAQDLPPADQILLRRGLRIENDQQLYAVLENYL